MDITVLKNKRLETGISQIDMAKASKKSIRMYKYYEAGKREPSVSTAIWIAETLDVPVNQDFKDLFPLPGEESKYRTQERRYPDE